MSVPHSSRICPTSARGRLNRRQNRFRSVRIFCFAIDIIFLTEHNKPASLQTVPHPTPHLETSRHHKNGSSGVRDGKLNAKAGRIAFGLGNRLERPALSCRKKGRSDLALLDTGGGTAAVLYRCQMARVWKMINNNSVVLIYESPDDGQTVYARNFGDYTRKWRVDWVLLGRSTAVAARKFADIEGNAKVGSVANSCCRREMTATDITADAPRPGVRAAG